MLNVDLISEDECENALAAVSNGDMNSLTLLYHAYGLKAFTVYRFSRSVIPKAGNTPVN